MSGEEINDEMISKNDTLVYDEIATSHNIFFKLFESHFLPPELFQIILSQSFWNRHSNVPHITTSRFVDGSMCDDVHASNVRSGEALCEQFPIH